MDPDWDSVTAGEVPPSVTQTSVSVVGAEVETAICAKPPEGYDDRYPVKEVLLSYAWLVTSSTFAKKFTATEEPTCGVAVA